ncbi:MAG: hypothetical protein CFE23_11595 [Flavobacterium sp. BFFFF1]|uniref:hypothetical protein n=1 Tax=Flavobacterium sp. BFFFF1 TaxID=2015557 RepID=UPI000BC4F5E6|nr:hypothetical protein [Flavobacterium sp. BFFFF1]OYU79892.1 MAG: hypothetical protein CFE23_11595 [Flavobacterium sp. BFFFF1]
MKKILLLLLFVGLSASCTSDDDPILNASITLGTETYTMNSGNLYYGTSSITGLHTAEFMITQGEGLPSLFIQLNKPDDGQSLTGTYHFDREQHQPDYVSATFSPSNDTYTVIQGTLDVEQLAADRFRFAFHNSKGMSFNDSSMLELGGTVQGEFVVFE